MQNQRISFDLSIFKSADELSEEHRQLLETADKSRADAYAPYSGFKVGAAVLLENGEVVIGNNQENASYPSGLCAERVAVFQASAKFPGVPIKAIAITAASSKTKVEKPAAPCGNCRQAISEYEENQGSPIAILMKGETGPIYKTNSMADLLPLTFSNSFLK